MAGEFARTGEALEKRIVEVKELSNIAVAKEQEKQQILATQNETLEIEVQHRIAELNKSLKELKQTQAQLIQSEKMASLGELTTGIAHEIQNPLNFVNNFSELKAELIDELRGSLKLGNTDDALSISNDIKENAQKISHHGKRADMIVKGMLQHSRVSNGVKEPTSLNLLANEYLRLSYGGVRAKDNSFSSMIQNDFDDRIGKVSIVPQDIGRVLLNLYNNAFYTVNEKKKLKGVTFEPAVHVSTKILGDKVEIRVKDNGIGIPDKIKDKIFQPFFTTKPTGKGTGLGLSLSYDIVKAHGTNKGKVIIPKNVQVRDATNNLVPLGGSNINAGGFIDGSPLFLKGDRIKIKAGYRFRDLQQNDILSPADPDGSTATIFQGFITGVASKKPIELSVEDNMWKLKQLVAPNKTYLATDTLETILKDLLRGTPFTVNVLTSTTFGAFRTQNETVAEVLARLQKDYHFNSYFRGNELRSGAEVYVEADAIADGKKVFKFQHDIIEDQLEYKRKDDINLSAVAYSVNKNTLATTTRSGKTKSKTERLEVLVTYQNGQFLHTTKTPGQTADFAPATAGERRTFFFNNITDIKTLGDLADKQLKKYFYTGMRGNCTTFGIPLVKMGDNIDILDPILPERNGRYKCKSVEYSGGESGLRQKIELDYLITRLDSKGNTIS